MPLNEEFLKILRCPITGKGLLHKGENRIVTEDGAHEYTVIDGIYFLLPDIDENQKLVQSFYDDFGWQKKEGVYCDTRTFSGKNGVVNAYSRQCMLSVKKLLPLRGKYILDAGCGAIPHTEYLTYHENFSKRICLDFSVRALQEAKSKVGNEGFYILGDITCIPIHSNCVDAAISLHAIYHVPKDKQADAFEEIARVVKDDGVGIIVYSWAYAPLDFLIRALARLFLKRQPSEFEQRPPLYYYAHRIFWFIRQNWKFSYQIKPFRIVTNQFLAEYGYREFIVKLLENIQERFPKFCAYFGKYPTIVIKKNS